MSVSSRPDGYDIYLYEFSTVSWLCISLILTLILIHSDYGHMCCSRCQSLQWTEHERMDRLGFFRGFSWHSPRLGLYGIVLIKPSTFVTDISILGHLLCRLAWMDQHLGLWERPLSLQIGVLLAMHTAHCRPLSRPSISRQSLEIRLRSR